MKPHSFPIADLVPHAGPMLLLDALVSVDKGTLTARVTPRADDLFDVNGEVGAWLGLEYMAQTTAALAGWEGLQRGETPRVGFILGTRRYVTHVSSFVVGQPLLITVTREFEADNGIGVTACRITSPDGVVLAEAMISAYQPDDLAAYLKEHA
ncbi:hotdog family protein [Silvimonas sp. JCM 19000]